jgi:hypothetical protein
MSFADPGTGRHVIVSPGPEAAMVTVAEAVKEGDILGYSSGWKRALSTVATAIQGRLVALKDTVSGGKCPVATHCVVEGYTGGTAGNWVYVAEGTDYGMVTDTKPSTAGDINNRVGLQISATAIAFSLGGIQVPGSAITDAPAGGSGATAGAYDSSSNRDLMIAAVNNIIAALEAAGIILKD